MTARPRTDHGGGPPATAERASRQYLLFAGTQQRPNGGLGDLVATFTSEEAARVAFQAIRLRSSAPTGWAQLAVVDEDQRIEPMCWFGIGAEPRRQHHFPPATPHPDQVTAGRRLAMTVTTATDLTDNTQSHPPGRIGPAAVALLVAAPVADAVASALHPTMPADLAELLAVVDRTSAWYAMSLIGLLASGLFVALSVVLGRLVRRGSPILGTIGLVATFAGGMLMASMQGFKLFMPTLARLAPADGAAAIDAFTAGDSFAPMIGGFVLRAVGLVLLAIAATRSGVVRWPVSLLVAAGAVAAFQLPAGPDALGWLLVAVGTACIARSALEVTDSTGAPHRLLIRMATWRSSAP